MMYIKEVRLSLLHILAFDIPFVAGCCIGLVVSRVFLLHIIWTHYVCMVCGIACMCMFSWPLYKRFRRLPRLPKCPRKGCGGRQYGAFCVDEAPDEFMVICLKCVQRMLFIYQDDTILILNDDGIEEGRLTLKHPKIFGRWENWDRYYWDRDYREHLTRARFYWGEEFFD